MAIIARVELCVISSCALKYALDRQQQQQIITGRFHDHIREKHRFARALNFLQRQGKDDHCRSVDLDANLVRISLINVDLRVRFKDPLFLKQEEDTWDIFYIFFSSYRKLSYRELSFVISDVYVNVGELLKL